MKTSIANIQSGLNRLQFEQVFGQNESPCGNILPQKIVHEDIFEKPIPTPKVTACEPNIVKT